MKAVNYPYELHFTIEKVDSLNQFLDDCCSIGNLKPVILDLYTNNDTIHQLTTSSIIENVDDDVIYLKNKLIDKNYNITRTKIETVPWNPICKTLENDSRYYYETHYTFLMSKTQANIFKTSFNHTKLRISKNTLKNEDSLKEKLMGTIRTYAPYDVHLQELYNLEYNYDINYTKKITEFALFDSNTSLDNNWI